jgi:hypothetical protein
MLERMKDLPAGIAGLRASGKVSRTLRWNCRALRESRGETLRLRRARRGNRLGHRAVKVRSKERIVG